MNRITAAARLFLLRGLVGLGIPWAVVLSSFAINLAIWATLPAGIRAEGSTGGIVSLYIAVMVVFLQAVTQLFPLAMGLSLSRRTFYLGTLLAAAVLSLGYGIALTLLSLVENATNGWGLGLSFWAPGRLDTGNPALQIMVFAFPMLLATTAGVGLGVVSKRWGQWGMWSLTIAALLVAGLAIFLITWSASWGAVGTFFAESPLAVLTVLLPAAITCVLAALAFRGLRRAVP